jgi:hypothetical protein
VGQLREKFEETWGEPTNTRNKQWLVKRIAWKMQANIEGDISERARRRGLCPPPGIYGILAKGKWPVLGGLLWTSTPLGLAFGIDSPLRLLPSIA